MSELLIFGGTSEGRRLTEFCVDKGIDVCVSSATGYGALLLPKGVHSICGRLEYEQIVKLLTANSFKGVVDATHPYAIKVTENVKKACEVTGVKYIRLLRESGEVSGKTVDSTGQLAELLNRSDMTVFSTLGSNYLELLSRVDNCFNRVWLRLLDVRGIVDKCRQMGFDSDKLIMGKGPFTVEDNVRDITKSGAQLLLTKESGKAGGYSEKIKAAEICGIETLTLTRPVEQGYTFEQVQEEILKLRGEEQP